MIVTTESKASINIDARYIKQGKLYINGKLIYQDKNNRWVTTELLTPTERKAFDKQIS